MRRLTLLVLLLPLTGYAAAAQPPTKAARIGMLCPVRCVGAGYVAFDEELRKLGWVEGTNLTIERRGAEGRYERFRDLAADLVRMKPDVIVGPTENAAR